MIVPIFIGNMGIIIINPKQIIIPNINHFSARVMKNVPLIVTSTFLYVPTLHKDYY